MNKLECLSEGQNIIFAQIPFFRQLSIISSFGTLLLQKPGQRGPMLRRQLAAARTNICVENAKMCGLNICLVECKY